MRIEAHAELCITQYLEVNRYHMLLLRIDHWKLFLLLLTPAILGGLVLLFGDAMLQSHAVTLMVSQLLSFVFIGVFVWWIYTIAIHLARLGPNQSRNLSLFKSGLLFALIYRVLIDLYMLWFGLTHGASMDLENALWVVPFHLLATVAVLYCFVLNATLLVSTEQQQPRSFRDAWKTFVLLLVFPIGLWFVQPRLQSIFGRR